MIRSGGSPADGRHVLLFTSRCTLAGTGRSGSPVRTGKPLISIPDGSRGSRRVARIGTVRPRRKRSPERSPENSLPAREDAPCEGLPEEPRSAELILVPVGNPPPRWFQDPGCFGITRIALAAGSEVTAHRRGCRKSLHSSHHT